jgi:hypothetical protein
MAALMTAGPRAELPFRPSNPARGEDSAVLAREAALEAPVDNTN